MLTASDRLQFAYDAASDGGAGGGAARYSRFTSWLIEGIETGSAAPSDETITIGSLRNYVVGRAQADGGVMRPQEFASGEARDMIIARNPLAADAAIPPDVRTRVAADGWQARAAAVIELTGYLAARNVPRAAAARRLLEQRLDDEWDRRVHLQIQRALAADAASPREKPPEAAQPAPGTDNPPEDQPFAPALVRSPELPPKGESGVAGPVNRRLFVDGLAAAGAIGVLGVLASHSSLKPHPEPAPDPVPEPAVSPQAAPAPAAQSTPPAPPRPDWATRRGQDDVGRFADILVGGVTTRLRWVPPGHFTMGSPSAEWGRDSDEGPQREVKFASGFWLFETPCTQALWQAVMGVNPSRVQGPDRPVETVSFADVRTFLTKINATVPGLKLELPSEARWEYAARAGTKTATYNGDLADDDATQRRVLDPIAWWFGNSGGGTHPVGQKRPNAWGLKDMLGDVWEWCGDNWHDGYTGAPTDGSAWLDPAGGAANRVVRGGSWFNVARPLRVAFRSRNDSGNRNDYLGFRCARVQES